MKLFAVVALLAAAVSTVSGDPKTVALQPFTSINVCLPFNLAVGPSTGGAYQLIVDADPGVAEAIVANVTNGSLTLKIAGQGPTTRTFAAPNLIKVAVQLPADKLGSVAVSSIPSITVAVDQGFTSSLFGASLSGTSTLSVRGLQADKLQAINSGTGTIYINGKIGAAQIISSGTGTTYVTGVSNTAAVDASGISKVYLGAAAQTQISGQVSGISNVYYDQGVCTIASQFGGIFGNPCLQQALNPPESLATPQWSCAVTVYGTFGCSDGVSTANNGGSTSSSSSSTGGSGSGTTMTTNTVNGVTTTTSGSQNPDGTRTLNTNTGTLQIAPCNTTGNSLMIWATS